MTQTTGPTDTEEMVRTPSGETWRGIPVVAYQWWSEHPECPLPGLQSIPHVAYHWSTGPKDAEPLIRLSDARAALEASGIAELQAENARLRELVERGAQIIPLTYVNWHDHARTALERRCQTCDGTGDVHRIDGEWLGYCDCLAGVALERKP